MQITVSNKEKIDKSSYKSRKIISNKKINKIILLDKYKLKGKPAKLIYWDHIELKSFGLKIRLWKNKQSSKMKVTRL